MYEETHNWWVSLLVGGDINYRRAVLARSWDPQLDAAQHSNNSNVAKQKPSEDKTEKRELPSRNFGLSSI